MLRLCLWWSLEESGFRRSVLYFIPVSFNGSYAQLVHTYDRNEIINYKLVIAFLKEPG
jgi:hypothetical protein